MITQCAILIGICCGVLVLVWHILCASELMYAALQATIVAMLAAIVVHFSLQWIGKIVLVYLKKQRQNENTNRLESTEMNKSPK